MRVGGHVERNAVDGAGEIGSVVQVVAAQEILVRLAVTRVLRHHHARNGLQHFAGSQQWQISETIAQNHALRCRVRSADAVVVVRFDFHLRQ